MTFGVSKYFSVRYFRQKTQADWLSRLATQVTIFGTLCRTNLIDPTVCVRDRDFHKQRNQTAIVSFPFVLSEPIKFKIRKCKAQAICRRAFSHTC